MKRMALAVIELCDESGNVTPLCVVKNGKQYDIDRIRRVSRHAPNVECVSPMRYDCIIAGVEKTLYRDAYPSQKWFSIIHD